MKCTSRNNRSWTSPWRFLFWNWQDFVGLSNTHYTLGTLRPKELYKCFQSTQIIRGSRNPHPSCPHPVHCWSAWQRTPFLCTCGRVSDGQAHLESLDILQNGLQSTDILNLLSLLVGERTGVWGGGQDWGEVVNWESKGDQTEKNLRRGSENAGPSRAMSREAAWLIKISHLTWRTSTPAEPQPLSPDLWQSKVWTWGEVRFCRSSVEIRRVRETEKTKQNP